MAAWVWPDVQKIIYIYIYIFFYAAQVAKPAGWTAARAERTKRTRFRKDLPDHADLRSVLVVVETCGYMRREAVRVLNRLGDCAESGCIPMGAFVHWAMQLLSAMVQRGEAEMYYRSGLVISHEQGLRYDVGFAVPVLTHSDAVMGHVYGPVSVAVLVLQ